MYALIVESPTISIPQKVVERRDNLRFECVLQTVGVVNRNKRRYSKSVLNEGLESIKPIIKSGALLGELDHPLDRNLSRQMNVLYKECSHRILDYGWDGNKLKGVVETLRTWYGQQLRCLIEDGVPVGFSFRGLGDLQAVTENGTTIYEVKGPLSIVTWDAVHTPSHSDARITRRLSEDEDEYNEVDNGVIYLDESALDYLDFYYQKQLKRKDILNSDCLKYGVICTKSGVCYMIKRLPKKNL